MAILHGEPAKWPKAKAQRQFDIVIVIISLVAMLSGIGIGLGIHSKPLFGTISMVAGVSLSFLFARLLHKPIRELGKERIKHWRGAQTEAYVAFMIKSDLSNEWHLFNSVKLQQTWDIDHILLGPGGLFAISTKSQRGCFSLAPSGTLLLNGKPTELASQAMSQALELRSRLEALMGAEVPFVQPILAAPFAYTDMPERQQKVWILHQENLTDTFESKEKRTRFSKPELQRILHTLETLAQNADKIWRKPHLQNASA